MREDMLRPARLRLLDSGPSDFVEVEARGLGLEARSSLGYLRELVEQYREAVRLAKDGLVGPLGLLVALNASKQELSIAADRRQGRTQLMDCRTWKTSKGL